MKEPRPASYHAKRLFVPWEDFPAVTLGSKTEFRVEGGHRASMPRVFTPPEVVIAWAQVPFSAQYRAELVVLEEAWIEPLGAISAESLAREGFTSFDDFRAYWLGRMRGQRLFRPLHKVFCYRTRAFKPDDRPEFERSIFDRLYGPWL